MKVKFNMSNPYYKLGEIVNAKYCTCNFCKTEGIKSYIVPNGNLYEYPEVEEIKEIKRVIPWL